MGLPGSGKTTLAENLAIELRTNGKSVYRLNADNVRAAYNDWDFSIEGRLRQAQRMFDLSNNLCCDYVICDFVSPLEEMRSIYNADYTIWMDTIENGRFEDTNKLFVPPMLYDLRVKSFENLELKHIINNLEKLNKKGA